MGIVHASVVAAPQSEVLAWHERPGAIHRLTPPWQPVSVVEEASSLRDGRAVLRFPGGVRWVAQHDPAGYVEGWRFVDQLAGGPLHPALRWRHTHEFAPADGGTRVVDRVRTPVPAALLRPVFAYRSRQLAGDLAAHGWAAAQGTRPLTVAVTGSSGTVGSALVPFLTTGGHRVVRLVRRDPRRADERRWDPHRPAGDLLAGVDAVVHLAGAGIGGRFTERHRAEVLASRLLPTRRLAELAASSRVETLVTASAVGIYGPDRGDEVLTEESAHGRGFLADLVAAWEQATEPASGAGVRVVRVRTGLVQTPRGGVLRLQRRLFAAGLGGPLGDGDQWWPWIAIDDLVDVYHRALVDDAFSGPVNAVAPEPVRNRDHARVLGRVLRRPVVLPVPDRGPVLVLGRQGAEELALAGQRVRPAVLAAAGHRFRHPQLEPALRHLLGR